MAHTRTRPRVVDYDRPARKPDDGMDMVDALAAGTRLLGGPPPTRLVIDDEDDADPADDTGGGRFDLLGAEWLGDVEFSMPVVPVRADEFTCTRCFLVLHRSRLASGGDLLVCDDCA